MPSLKNAALLSQTSFINSSLIIPHPLNRIWLVLSCETWEVLSHRRKHCVLEGVDWNLGQLLRVLGWKGTGKVVSICKGGLLCVLVRDRESELILLEMTSEQLSRMQSESQVSRCLRPFPIHSAAATVRLPPLWKLSQSRPFISSLAVTFPFRPPLSLSWAGVTFPS